MDKEKVAESKSEGEGTHNYAPYFGFVFFFFSVFIPFYSFTLCTFNKSEKCQFDLSLTKLWMIYVKRLQEKKRFERQFQGSEASINLSYLYRISFEWLLN